MLAQVVTNRADVSRTSGHTPTRAMVEESGLHLFLHRLQYRLGQRLEISLPVLYAWRRYVDKNECMITE